jgi:5'/3'-nucleotidase SurE
MRVNVLSALVGSLALAKSSLAVNIISSNDDGWAEVNIRAFFDALTEADHSVVVSAPAENQSGKGSLNICHQLLPPSLTYNLQGPPRVLQRHLTRRASSRAVHLVVRLWGIMPRSLV